MLLESKLGDKYITVIIIVVLFSIFAFVKCSFTCIIETSEHLAFYWNFCPFDFSFQNCLGNYQCNISHFLNIFAAVFFVFRFWKIRLVFLVLKRVEMVDFISFILFWILGCKVYAGRILNSMFLAHMFYFYL